MTRVRLALPLVAVAAAIAAVSISSSAAGTSFGSLSKKIKALQRQVTSIQKQKGPAGTNGADGAPGTARAYALIIPGLCTGSSPAVCDPQKSKGITSVTRPFAGTGQYCVTAPGIDATAEPADVSVDNFATASPEGDARVQTGPDCSADSFAVYTGRGSAFTAAEDVGFNIVIP